MINTTWNLVGDVFNSAKIDSDSRRAINRNLVAAGFLVEGEMIMATPVGATGSLRQGWASEHDPQNLQVTVFNAVEHGLPTELGRRAAPVPIKPLQLWVRRKLGIGDEQKALGVAIAISKKKAKNATPGQFFVDDTWRETRPKVQKNLLNVVGADIVRALEQ